VDGYWSDLTKNVCPGTLTPEYVGLLELLLDVYRRAIDHLRPGASMAELDRLIRAGIAEGGYPGRTRRAGVRSARGWCWPSSPASTGRAAGG
jgi:Xaa-Pro aminopeptidase